MTAQATLSIADAVPTNRSYVPAGARMNPNGSVFSTWINAASSILVGQNFLVERWYPSVKGLPYRMKYELTLPVTASVDGRTEVVRTPRAIVDFYLPPESNLADRMNLVHLTGNLLALTDIRTSVGNAEAHW